MSNQQPTSTLVVLIPNQIYSLDDNDSCLKTLKKKKIEGNFN